MHKPETSTYLATYITEVHASNNYYGNENNQSTARENSCHLSTGASCGLCRNIHVLYIGSRVFKTHVILIDYTFTKTIATIITVLLLLVLLYTI